MNRKILAAIGYALTVIVILTPFYSEIALLSILPSYFLTSFWFVLIFIFGLKELLGWIFISIFVVVILIIASYGLVGLHTSISIVLGIIWAVLISYSKNIEITIWRKHE